MPLAAGIGTPFINRSAEEVEPASVHKNPTRHLPRMSVSLTDEDGRNPPLAIWCCAAAVLVSRRTRACTRHSSICASGRGQLHLQIGGVPAPMERHPDGNRTGWTCLEKVESSSEGKRSKSGATRSAGFRSKSRREPYGLSRRVRARSVRSPRISASDRRRFAVGSTIALSVTWKHRLRNSGSTWQPRRVGSCRGSAEPIRNQRWSQAAPRHSPPSITSACPVI